MVARARIIGVGSDHGDDRVGWMLVQRFVRRASNGIVASHVRNPLDMLAEFDGTPRVYLVDGCLTGAAAGTLSRLRWPDVRILSRHCRSSHALSVADALRLAESLETLPGELIVFGVELGCVAAGSDPTAALARRLPAIQEAIWSEVTSAVKTDEERR